MKIQSFLNSTPVQTLNISRITKPILKPNVIDSFQKSTEIIKLEQIYHKLSEMTSQVSPEKIEKIINKFNQYPQEQVLLVMKRLTGFSNSSKIMDFKNWLDSHKIEYIENFRNVYGKKKKTYCYETRSKAPQKPAEHHEIQKEIIPQGKLLTLNQVFSYFYNNGFGTIGKCPLNGGYLSAIILDSRTIDYLNELKNTNTTLFKTLQAKNKFIYIKDFEGSYNIFEQHKDFEKLVEEKLSMLNRLKKSSPNRSDEELMDTMLNGRNLKRIKDLGITPVIADLNANNNPSPKNIADNLLQTFPSKEEFIKTAQKCIKQGCTSETERKNLLEYMDKHFYACSFKTMSEKLVKLKQLIENDVRKSGKDVSKIYYNVTKPEKSFSLINYMYQLANDIPPNRFVYWENSKYGNATSANNAYKTLSEQLPKGSTLVTLDDAFISGESIFHSQFNYKSWRDKDSFDMIFASIYSSGKAKERLNGYIEKTHNDRIISADYQDLKDVPVKSTTLEPYKNTLILFPYNSPYNNSILFQDLYRLFYPNRSFVQHSWIYQ